MAAWWPYWISDQAEIQFQPTMYRGESENVGKISQGILKLLVERR